MLNVIEAAPAGGAEAGPPVVLLHGLLGNARNFGGLHRRLAARRRVLALDLRNHGDSPHAPGMDYAAMAADVAATLAARGAVPAAVMGHSMGGKVAMRLALDRPDLVARLLVSDIAPVAYPPDHGRLVRALRALRLDAPLSRAQADASLAAAVPDPAIRAFLLQNLRPGAAPSWRIGLDEIAAGLDDIVGWQAPAARFDGPARFVAGARSTYIRPDDHAAIRALFPRADIVTVADAGHWVHADNPEGFFAALDAFLAAPA